jgi:hypothetical protein
MDDTAPTFTAVTGALTGRRAPRTVAEWKALIAQADTRAVALIPGLAEHFPHTVVRRLIAGVTFRAITPATLDPALRL